MTPDCSPQQIKARLGISWKNLRHLRKVAPWPDVAIDSIEFEEWATHKLAGALIHNMRAGRPTPKLILNTPEHNEPISIYDAMRRLARRSPYYSNALLGCDEQGRFAIIGTDGLYVPLGNWHEAHRWLMAKCAERKAA